MEVNMDLPKTYLIVFTTGNRAGRLVEENRVSG